MSQDALDAGVRTVTHMAVYLEELREKARWLAENVAAEERGYFTTTEEEETVALLVSYWHTRNALFELITSFREETDSTQDEHPASFLIAFAAALILIDAARFLREIVGPRAVVRDKLNEPVPQFEIPAGVYDTVQQSLLSARHGWHLYHAVQYFQQHQARLRRVASENNLDGLLEIIDRLYHQVEVSVLQFARAKLRTRGAQILRRLVDRLLWRAMYGLQKLAGSLLADKNLRMGHHPGLAGNTETTLQSMLTPGDVIVVRKEYAITNYFLPGYWPHAALYLGHIQELKRMELDQQDIVRPRWQHLVNLHASRDDRVLESMKDGVHIRTLESPFASDSVVILRPKLSPTDLASALGRSLAHEGKPYDFDFDFRRSDRLVCTEVIYRAFDGIGAINLPLVVRAGRPTLSGSDLIQLALKRNCFQPIAVHAPAMSPGIATGDDADLLLRRGCAPT